MRRTAVLAPAALLLVLIALVLARSPGTTGDHRAAGPRKPAVTPSHLLSLRVADPGGGAPWGMRLLRTSGGLLCAQVGRVVNGALGQLGVDGAFRGDNRFHPLAQGQFAEVSVPGTVGDDADCVASKETFSGTIDGLDRNAVDNRASRSGPLAQRREIAYGLLGRHALRITYRDGARTVSQPVVPRLGAFLVVRVARQRRYLGTGGAAPGSDYSDDLAPAGPTGFIEAITYRFGRTVCRDIGTNTVARCHLPNYPLGPERTPSQKGY